MAVGAYAWWVAGLAHFSLPALAAVLAAGALTIGVAWWRGHGRPPARAGPVRLGAWPIVLGALLVWELVAYSLSPRATHPTLSSIADAALGPRPIEAAAFVAWLALGWWLARR